MLAVDKLLEQEIYPVCSLALLRSHPGAAAARRPRQSDPHLTTSLWNRHASFASRESWFERVTHTQVHKKPGLRINNPAAVMPAAMDGQGAALAHSVMANDDFATGRSPVPRRRVHVAAVVLRGLSARMRRLPELAGFRERILRETAKEGRRRGNETCIAAKAYANQ